MRITDAARRGRAWLDRRARWLAEPCQCGDARRDHLSGHEMCAECPCREFAEAHRA